jgi:flagellar motility protein MotE (MotC chaperone)
MRGACCAVLVVFIHVAVACAEESPVLQPVAVSPAATEDFCANIADRARDARYVLQKKAIDDARKQIKVQRADLKAREEAFDALQKKRESEISIAQQGLVDIYAKMKPDAAAAQLELIGVETASAILHQLSVRSASTILNQMDAQTAAKISARLASAAGLSKDSKIP